MTKPRRADQFEVAHFAMSAETAARTLDISVTTLQELVIEGRIPKPFPIPGHPRLQRWDAEDIWQLVKDWKAAGNPATEEWGDVR